MLESSPTPTNDLDPRLAAPLQTRDPDRYEILGEHGRGGLGRVFRARDKELGRDIAVKELLERGNTSEVRFLREALITARLEHPGIVPVHEAGRWPDGTPFYAMKLVSGSPLKTLIERAETMEARLALIPNVIAVADAIAYAHDRKIIHRDLKPSNVIVGEFGETVVIDWGLAKALDEIPTAIDSPYRGSQGHELTASGSVLGTPAYMAPEQHKGLADERTDVYALGGILFNVLAGRVPHRDEGPPSYTLAADAFPRETPRDLVAIVRSAMAEQPGKRYATARAFADDLRHYVQRLPVTVRRYSSFARIGRAFARHRTAALSFVFALLAIVATLAVSLVRINRERNDAESSQLRAESANDDLILQHAALLLHSDPTASLAALDAYRGPNNTRRQVIEAEAVGRGVAEIIPAHHRDWIRSLAVTDDGSVVSTSAYGHIELTRDGQSITVADDVARYAEGTYSRRNNLLVYPTASSETVAMDLATRHKQVLFHDTTRRVIFSPDESELATLSADGTLQVWRVAAHPTAIFSRVIPDALNMIFADSNRLVVVTPNRYMVLSLTGQPDVTKTSADAISFDTRDERIVTGDRTGTVDLWATADVSSLGSISACRDAVTDVILVANSQAIAFTCEGGDVGIIRYESGLSKQLLFTTRYPPQALSQAFDGGRIAVASGTELYVHDVARGVTEQFSGHAADLSAIAPPSPSHPEFLSGDVSGRIRRWRSSPGASRLLISTGVALSNAEFSNDSKSVAVGDRDGVVRIVGVDGTAIKTMKTDSGPITVVKFSPDGKLLLATSSTTAYVWSVDDFSLVRTFTGHGGLLEDVSFVDNGRELVSSGADGRLLRWAPGRDDEVVLFSTALPLQWVEVNPKNSSIVVHDTAGAVWVLEGRSPARMIRVPNKDDVQFTKFSQDGRILLIGTRAGQVEVIDTATYKRVSTALVGGSVLTAALSPNGSFAAVNTDEGSTRILQLERSTVVVSDVVDVNALMATISPDGRVLGLIDGNGIWFWGTQTKRWQYVRDHYQSLTVLERFSPDGKLFVSTGSKGDLVIRDVDSTVRGLR